MGHNYIMVMDLAWPGHTNINLILLMACPEYVPVQTETSPTVWVFVQKPGKSIYIYLAVT